MSRSIVVLAVLGLTLTACGKSEDKPAKDPGTTDTEDTDIGDTDVPTIPERAGASVAVNCDCSGGPDLRVGLMLTEYDAETDDVVYVREYTSTAAPSFPVDVAIPAPEDDDISSLDEFSGALFLVYLYEDLDGDGVHGTGEPMVATTASSPTFLDDGVSGLWVLLELDLIGDEDPGQGLLFSGIDLTAFSPTPTLDFGGTLDVGADTPERLAIASLAGLAGTPMTGRLHDDVYTGGPFAFNLDAPPDPSRITESELTTEVAYEVPIAYIDTDGSGAYDVDDEVVGWGCTDDRPFGLIYFPQPVTLQAALVGYAVGYQPGWNPVAAVGLEEAPEVIDPAAAQSLVLSATACPGVDDY